MATRRAQISSFALRAALPLVLLTAASVPAQPPLQPVQGRVIEAADGDVIVLTPRSRVAIVRRTRGEALLLYAPDRRSLALVMEPDEDDPDGMTGGKRFRTWTIVQGEWPFGPRWIGEITLDEFLPSGRGPGGLAIHTPRGTVVIGHFAEFPISPAPIASLRSNSSRAGSAGGTFQEIEQRWLTGGDEALAHGGRAMSGRVALVGGIGSMSTTTQSAAPSGAVRVGGNIRAPTRLNQVAPVYPQQAKDAGVQGVVILELVVGVDGNVTDARVLRSIPLLDDAALECVRQWRYEPTLLNGAAVPVVMTVTVNFTLGP
jgi:TonB family protein